MAYPLGLDRPIQADVKRFFGIWRSKESELERVLYRASASVVTEQPSTIYHLSVDGLKQMEETDPEIAAAFHKFIVHLLGERLVNTNKTLQALLD